MYLNLSSINSKKAMSTTSFLPPRGIFVPTQIIFHPELPSASLVTWIQLRCLAWRGWSTPPLSIAELASLTGIHPARLQRHLAQLAELSTLSWRTLRDGKVIVSFPADTATQPDSYEEAHYTPVGSTSVNKKIDTTDHASYFPRQILGYLAYPEDQEEYSPVEDHGNSIAIKIEDPCFTSSPHY